MELAVELPREAMWELGVIQLGTNKVGWVDMKEGARKQAEIEFHNRRERDRLSLEGEAFEKKYSNKKFYSIVRKSRNFVSAWLAQNCPGKVALDYGCGLGGMCVKLIENGAFVYGIDISGESIKSAQKLLADEGFARSASLHVMDAENLSFESDCFDIIVCSGVLHHLDINKAYEELARVLKSDGKILCMEALGHNPAINLYRKLTPHLRTRWEADHILKMKDIKMASRLFECVDVHFFHLFSLTGVLFRTTPIFSAMLSLLEVLDSMILKIPYLKYMAWQVVFELSGPYKGRDRWISGS